jgi:hypothetical protein
MSPFLAVFPPILDIEHKDHIIWTPHLAILLAAVAASIAWEFVSSSATGRGRFSSTAGDDES